MSRLLFRSWGAVTLTLGGLCALLGLVLILQRLFAGGSEADGAVQVTAAGAEQVSGLETRRFELPAETEYAVITARPLFHEDRRPEQRDSEQEDGQQVAEEQAPAEPPPVTLTGVIITPEKRIAMMRNTQSKEYVTLKEGDPLEGWTLEKVQQRRIVFNSGQEQSIVELDVYTGPAGQGRARGGASAQDADASGQQQNNGPQVIDAGEKLNNSSAAQAIRERIERERERRRQLIEEARKRQQQSEDNQ